MRTKALEKQKLVNCAVTANPENKARNERVLKSPSVNSISLKTTVQKDNKKNPELPQTGAQIKIHLKWMNIIDRHRLGDIRRLLCVNARTLLNKGLLYNTLTVKKEIFKTRF